MTLEEAIEYVRESFASYNRESSSLKTLQRSLFEDSTACSVTLPRAGTMRSGSLCVLPTLEHRTCESGCLSWPTPTVCGNHNSKGASKRSGDGLSTASKRWATPTVNGASTNSSAPPSQRKRRCKGVAVEAGASRELPLNPAWVDCLMGFPEGWTDPGPQHKAKPNTSGNRRVSRRARADESND